MKHRFKLKDIIYENGSKDPYHKMAVCVSCNFYYLTDYDGIPVFDIKKILEKKSTCEYVMIEEVMSS